VIDLVGHLLDFGMVVLLWLVQLVIYPSFLKVRPDALQDWHRTYTFRAGFIIIPMLFGQLGVWLYKCFLSPSILNCLGLMLVVVAWILTFTVSVPLHRAIEKGERSETVLRRLVQTNWPRTICWSAVFIVGIVTY
jgi:hypothetical protein